MAPRLSILIVNWNTREDLLACLGSLRAAAVAVPHEVIVVDNASADGSADAVAAAFPEVRLLRAPTNLGFAAGNNRALAEAGGELVLLLNPDTLVAPGQLERLVAHLDAHPAAGVVGPKLRFGDGAFQLSATPFVTVPDVYFEFARFPRALQPRAQRTPRRLYAFPDAEALAVDTVMGAALLIRRSVVDAIGPLDEGYPMYGEEMDWCRRAKAAGWEVHWLPTAEVVHLGGRAAARVPYEMLAHRFAATFRFLRIHEGPGAAILARVLLGAAALQNAALILVRFLARRDDAATVGHELRGAATVIATALRGRARPLPHEPER